MAVHISTETELRKIVFRGHVTSTDFETLVATLRALDTSSDVTLSRLIIFEEDVVVDFRYPDVERLSTHQLTFPIANPIRSAIVATSPITVGYARMFQLMARHPLVEIRDFPSVTDAMRWLQFD